MDVWRTTQGGGKMTTSISNQAHIDPKILQQHNKNLQPVENQGTVLGQHGKEGEEAINKSITVNDTVTINQKAETTVTYSSSLTMGQNFKGDGFDLLRGLVLNMLKEQGIDFKIANGDQEIDISKLTQEDAQALIADDGYFGVDKTSSRIVDFAIATAGGDPSKLAAIKEGVDKGFNEALKAFGGQLPDISYKTYDAVMEKLDAWAENATSDQ
jgi:hypothetical protein